MGRSTRHSAAAAAAEETDKAVQDVVDSVVGAAVDTPTAKARKRLCRHAGCNKVIKSQGFCQRHGARAKRCKVEGCDKQAQGTHDGMCKRHWKAVHFPAPPPKPDDPNAPAAEGQSVYDHILPTSISYRPPHVPKELPAGAEAAAASALASGMNPEDDVPPPPEGVPVMPLVAFLHEGAEQEAGWHRNAERRARGYLPVTSLSSQLEPWERQLALVEILLLSGGTPYANFKDLSHAWGREKGFHSNLTTQVCERRGDIDRKRRSDARGGRASKKSKAAAADPEELKLASVEELVEEDKKESAVEV